MGERQPSPLAAGARRWLRRIWPTAEDRARRRSAGQLYHELVKHARTPTFYRDLGVPDTPEGRFEMVALHAALVIRRLRAEDALGRALGQELFDLMFADVDESLRHIGVGDLKVGKHVKRLAGNFYARLAALDEALAGGTAPLGPMLATNVYHGGTPPSAAQCDALAAWLVATARALDAQAGAAVLAGRVAFAAPEGRE
jgi:cytochrome b pre-mRNA-processing protein 3